MSEPEIIARFWNLTDKALALDINLSVNGISGKFVLDVGQIKPVILDTLDKVEGFLNGWSGN